MSSLAHYVVEVIERENPLDALLAMVIAWSASTVSPISLSLRRIHGIRDRDFKSAFNRALTQLKQNPAFKEKAIDCFLRAVDDIRVRKEIEEVGWLVSTPTTLQKILTALETLAEKTRLTHGLQTLLSNLSHIYESRFGVARITEEIEQTPETPPAAVASTPPEETTTPPAPVRQIQPTPPSHEILPSKELPIEKKQEPSAKPTPTEIVPEKITPPPQTAVQIPHKPEETSLPAVKEKIEETPQQKPVEKIEETPKIPSQPEKEKVVKPESSIEFISRIESELKAIRDEIAEVKQALDQLNKFLKELSSKFGEDLSQKVKRYFEEITSRITNMLKDLRKEFTYVEEKIIEKKESELKEVDIKPQIMEKKEEPIKEIAQEIALEPLPTEEEILPPEEELTPLLRTEEKLFIALGDMNKLQKLFGNPQEELLWKTNVVIGDVAYIVKIQGLSKKLPRDLIEESLKTAVGIIVSPFDDPNKNQKLWRIVPRIAQKMTNLKVIGSLSENVPENIRSLAKVVYKRINKGWESTLFLETLLEACGEAG